MPPASPRETAIDRLYQVPLQEFVGARNVLARQYKGEEARAVRDLEKPNTVAWGLNQVYWSARSVFDRLLEAASGLREAQAETLRGRPAELRAADAAHRQAVGDAVAQGARLLKAAGHPVGPDTLRSLTAAFEALPWGEPAGRLVRPPAPGGFSMFADMPVAAERQPRPEPEPAVAEGRTRAKAPQRNRDREAAAKQEAARRELEARQRQAQEAADEARRGAALAGERLRAADEQLTGARDAERAARRQLEEARRLLEEAEARHREALREAAAAEAAVRKADAAAARVAGRR
ncbi:MAG: hypothetical protein EHM24_09150 [Acidobacteria bacterium]|nr:MAG: hypothetical protein EHM24_09150 [Acidobacteriota bacterium]